MRCILTARNSAHRLSEQAALAPLVSVAPLADAKQPRLWVDTGRRESFWLIETGEERHEAWPKKLHGLSLRVMRSEELLAHSTRIRNWSQIVPYLVSFTRYQNRTLQQDVLHRLAKPYRLHGLEKEFHPVDTAAVRAALFALLAAGKVVAPELERVALSGQSLFRRVSR